MKFLTSTLALIFISLLVAPNTFAQFFYPSSSFFNPSANLYRGGKQNPIEWLTANDFQVFGFLLSISELKSKLNIDRDTITIFAPTDDAFAALPLEIRDKLSNPEKKQELLKYHFVDNAISESDIKQGKVMTLAGSSLQIQGQILAKQTTRIKLNDAIAKQSVKLNENLIIIVVDEVLLPPNF